MNTIFEEFGALIAIPFVAVIITGFIGILKSILELGMLYSIGC